MALQQAASLALKAWRRSDGRWNARFPQNAPPRCTAPDRQLLVHERSNRAIAVPIDSSGHPRCRDGRRRSPWAPTWCGPSPLGRARLHRPPPHISTRMRTADTCCIPRRATAWATCWRRCGRWRRREWRQGRAWSCVPQPGWVSTYWGTLRTGQHCKPGCHTQACGACRGFSSHTRPSLPTAVFAWLRCHPLSWPTALLLCKRRPGAPAVAALRERPRLRHRPATLPQRGGPGGDVPPAARPAAAAQGHRGGVDCRGRGEQSAQLPGIMAAWPCRRKRRGSPALPSPCALSAPCHPAQSHWSSCSPRACRPAWGATWARRRSAGAPDP